MIPALVAFAADSLDRVLTFLHIPFRIDFDPEEQ